MTGNLINRYIWLVDVLMRYGKLTRAQIDELWMKSSIGDGKPIPARTFFHYRRGIEENFHIDIKCTPQKEYYIEAQQTRRERAFTNWMLNSLSATSTLGDSGEDVSGRILLEEVPSAREFLPSVVEAIRNSKVIQFTYAGFNRSRAETGIKLSPWLIRLYKQRWYVLGLREKGNAVRTYALDRIKEMTITSQTFEMPKDVDTDSFFRDIIGITSSKAAVRTVQIKTNNTLAKYLRALPMHASQTEQVGDGYSIFSYKLKLNYELVHEIIAFGPQAKVLAPKELQLMVLDELKKTLDLY
ncbi:MAG: WYL domain-containing protein [Muribaculaceae bacterium]|nr:WYL domain-containing protein [Muribaculaceae bacterium]